MYLHMGNPLVDSVENGVGGGGVVTQEKDGKV